MNMLTFLMPLLFVLGHSANALSRSYDDLAESAIKKDNNSKARLFEVLSHTCNFSTILLFFLGVWFSINSTPPFLSYTWYWYLTILILTRSFYDYVRNLSVGKPLDYRGSALTDKLIIFLKVPESFLVMVRIIAIILAFTFAYRFKL